MCQHEFIGYCNLQMLQALRNRDNTDPSVFSEEHGYWQGQFKAYENILHMLMMFDVRPTDTIHLGFCPIA